MFFDNHTWDVKYCEFAKEETIRSAFKDARKAERVIFYAPNISDKRIQINSAIERELGRYRKTGRNLDELPDVYTMDGNGNLILFRTIKGSK